jgi:predicted phage-related endonuclease
MSAVLLGRHEPGSPEWHALRAEGIGASEVAAVLGLSPWQSRFNLWHVKAGTITETFSGNAATSWGTRLEPVVLDAYAEARDLLVAEGPTPDLFAAALGSALLVPQPGTFAHAERPWQRCNPDAIAHERLVEVKTARFADGWGADGSDEIPTFYRVQVVYAMDCLELPVCDVPVLIGGSDFRVFTIELDEAEATLIRDEVGEFWESIALGREPGLDESTSTADALRKLHPSVVDEAVVIDAELANRYLDSLDSLDDAKREADSYANQIRHQLGDGRRAVTLDGTPVATRSVSTPKRFDRKAFAADHPELDAAYTRAGEPETRLTPARRKTP